MNTHLLSTLMDGLLPIAAHDDRAVSGVAAHSDKVRPGDLYLAVGGEHHHGLDFMAAAIARGAVAVAHDGAHSDPHDGCAATIAAAGVPLIRVADLRDHLGLIAARLYDHPSAAMTLIAVTGTDGKTSLSHFIAESLTTAEQRCGLIGSLGYGCFGELQSTTHTTPDALAMQKIIYELNNQQVRTAVLEASSHGLAQGRLNALSIDTAVFTNLGHDHLDYHISRAAYAAAKSRLFAFDSVNTAVVNGDDEYAETMISSCRPQTQILKYSQQSSSADAYLLSAQHRPSGLAVSLSIHGHAVEIETALFGEFNIDNLLAAALVLVNHGLSIEQVAARLSAVHPVSGRMQAFGGGGAPTVFLDYAHTPQALAQVLKSCAYYTSGRLICVFGCGGERDASKRPLMGEVAQRYADCVVVCDDNPRGEDPEQIFADILAAIDTSRERIKSLATLHDRRQAISAAIAAAQPGDVVLVAGKGHEEYQIIGDTRLPLSDSAVIQNALETYSLENRPLEDQPLEDYLCRG